MALIAAVIAAKLKAKPPTGAVAIEAKPVVTITGLNGTSKSKDFMIAIPGMFCDAMVTRYRGIAIETTPVKVSSGMVNSMCGTSEKFDTEIGMVNAIATPIAAIAAGAAQIGANLYKANQTNNAGRITQGCAEIETNGLTQNEKITPANIDDAIGLGIDETNRPRAGHKPVRVNKAPETINDPTATGKPRFKVPAATSMAAPGVDQTIDTGILYRSESRIESTP